MSELPRKLSRVKELHAKMTDLPLLLEVYYFLNDELVGTLEGQAQAICLEKISEVRSAIEVNIFGTELSAGNSIEITGDKPEDIDLSQFDEEGK